jgi:ketosteroid isomerase-like protein
MTLEEYLPSISDKFLQDYQRGDTNACAMAYAEDGIRMEPGSPPLIGREAIAAALRASISRGVQILKFVTTAAVADQSIGYAILTVETNYGSSRVMLGMKRNNDGRWLVAAEAIVD